MAPITIQETPVKTADCQVPDCQKAKVGGYKTKKGLTEHVKKWHQVAKDGLSPVAVTARTLFQPNDDDLQASTQGNSAGEVNSPKVTSVGSFQCGVCEKTIKSRSEVDNHMKLHDKANNADIRENQFETDDDFERELTKSAEAHDAETAEIERLNNMMTVDKVVDAFVDMAFNQINPSIVTQEPPCEECVLKDQVYDNQEKLIDQRDLVIVEKTATINGMLERVKTLTSEKLDMQKKLKETESLKKTLTEKNKEISNLKAEVKTKDGLIAMAKAQIEPAKVQQESSDDITIEVEIKKCKKCKFTAPNLEVLALHIENDHQLEFDCNECNKKFPFKNQLKIHRREVHEQGSFACFVCNDKFKTHSELKQHIQKRCKTMSNTASNPILHKHNEDIHKEDEHKCPKCPKITNNQVSLVNHMNTMHKVVTEKCDTCGLEFESREVLIKHIVENHTAIGTQVIPRYICKVCNVEVHSNINKENHMCRKPQWGCDWCKQEFYSTEARKNHICAQHRFKSVEEQLRVQKRLRTECKNGAECWRAANNRCWFKHSQPVNVFPQQGQGEQGHVQSRQAQPGQGRQDPGQQGPWRTVQRQQRQGQQGQQGQGQQGQSGQGQTATPARTQLYCRYQESCFKGAEACRFKHFQVGFHQMNQPQTQQ